jgi:transcriptional regulator GlxA family with amidase domain
MTSASRSRSVGILVFDGVEVLDFAGPFEVFSVTDELNGGGVFDVATVAAREGVVRTIGGLQVVPSRTLEATDPPDVLVVPGGDGTRREMEDPAVIRWVRAAAETGEIVMSVCSGARILARAGLLSGLRVTTHHQVLDDIRELAPDATVEPSPRFIDTGRIITTGGISAGIDGALHVVSRLLGREQARRTAEYMEYGWREEGEGADPATG